MKEKIKHLQQMISAKDPQAIGFLQTIVNDAKTEEDKCLIDELAQSLLSSANQTLDTLEEEVTEYSIRQQMGHLADAINFAYIAREYFGKTRSWLYHKIKGDIVNGKPKVKRIEREDCIEFVLKYSLFHKEIKRYDKRTFEQLQ